MKKLTIVMTLTLVACFANADSVYSCRDSQHHLKATVTVAGAGVDAKIQVESKSLSGTLKVGTNGDAITPDGTFKMAIGEMVNKASKDKSSFNGGLFLEEALLDGERSGRLYIPDEKGRQMYSCNLKKQYDPNQNGACWTGDISVGPQVCTPETLGDCKSQEGASWSPGTCPIL
jgi:hypothetical protein